MKTIRFLVLEDDPQFRASLVEELNQTEGCAVVGEADDVEQGFDAIIDLKPDALLLDIELFGGTAFDILRRLRAHDIPIPPVVIITANAVFEYAAEAVDVCGVALVKIIGKPFWSNWHTEYPHIRSGILSRISATGPTQQDTDASITKAGDSIFIRSSQQTHRIHLPDVLLLDVKGEGLTRFIMSDGRIVIVRKTLNLLMETMPDHILRISRFNAVNMNKLLYINHEDDTLFLDGYKEAVTVGAPYMQKLKEYMAI